MSSSPAGGSTFWFEFPTPGCDAPDADPDSEAADTQTRPLRVLVAEDNLPAQPIIQTLLHALGHDVTVVNDAAPAIAAAASGACDVILLDMIMPGIEGATATRDIREPGDRAGGVPIIALTADVLFGKDHKHVSASMTDEAYWRRTAHGTRATRKPTHELRPIQSLAKPAGTLPDILLSARRCGSLGAIWQA
jgi:CheY-like chemotaxis protein